MATPGRNDPCPCGSGKKYKHCCATVAQARDPLEVAAELHAMDARLAAQLLSFGQSEYPTDFAKARKRIPFPDPVDAAHRSIFGHFLAYLSEVEAGSLLELFLARRKARLGPVELDWLEATRAAPLSVWEVLEVQPGRSMHLRDLFDGQEREVMERSATQTLQRRHAVCACVVQAGDVAVMAGGHPQPFEPVEAERVVRAMREFDAQQPPSVPASRRPALRNWALLNAWHSTARGLAERPLPTLVNMEGDPLQETEDRYRLAPGARPAVEKALGSLEGFDVLTLPDAESKEATLFNVTRNERPSHGAWEKPKHVTTR